MHKSITAKQVKSLSIKTGQSMMDCKRALLNANGDMNAALKLLQDSKGGKKPDASEPVI